MDIGNKVIQIVAIVLVVISTWLYIENLKSKSKIANLESNLVVCNTNKATVDNALKYQNEQIEIMKVDLVTSMNKYNELLNQPPEVRYEVVYKTVPTIEKRSDDCEDIKKLVDDIRNAGY